MVLTVYVQNYEPNVNNLPDTYCLATINNNQWYRAYIKNINEESVIINMFDVGLLTDVGLNQVIDILIITFSKSYKISFSILMNKQLVKHD